MSFKFRVALLVALSALVMSACASSGSADESGSPVEPVETAGVDTSAVCPDAENAAPERLPVGEVIELHDNGADHVVCASYNRTPPASGAHFPAWQNCGIYSQPIQNQTAVHSLEHGAVWVAYREDLDAAVIQTMTDQLKSEQSALVAPYPGLQNTFVLTAWTRQLAVDDWSAPRSRRLPRHLPGEILPGRTRGGSVLWTSRWLRSRRPESELPRNSRTGELSTPASAVFFGGSSH